MAENTQIDGSVTVQSNAKERVAFDLMTRITRTDSRVADEKNDRKYWLTLYSQCLKATSGYPLESVLEEE